MIEIGLRATLVGLALVAGALETYAAGAAIAWCEDTNGDSATAAAHGMSDNLAPTIEVARKQAIATCVARGGTNECCKIVLETDGGCVAIALDSTPSEEHSRRRKMDWYSYNGAKWYGVGEGPDMESARQAALHDCEEGPGGNVACVPLGVRCAQ
jgi:hypothetical protein